MAEKATGPQLSEEFREFLIEAKTEHGFGAPDVKVTPTESGGSRITYQNSHFLYVNTFEGGSPFVGHESVSIVEEGGLMPVWGMSYLATLRDKGHITDEEVEALLGTALRQPDPALPVRGPKSLESDDFHYALRPVDKNSSLESFDVEEIVRGRERTLYVARFMGGLVNRTALEVVENKFWLE